MDGGIIDLMVRNVPLWLIAILFALLCLGARQFGIWLHHRHAPKPGQGNDLPKSEAADHIIGAIFSLLAFIMGFTFAIATDRYDDRRAAVREEANGIRAIYFAASVLDESYAIQVQQSVREYARGRIAPSGLWTESADSLLEASRAQRLDMWTNIRAAVLPIRDTDLGTYLVESANEAVARGTHRELIGRAHLPALILDVLLVYTVAAAATLGFLIGPRSRGVRQASTVLLLLCTIAFIVIIDLDRPQAGLIRISQQPLEDLVATLDADAAGALTRRPPLPSQSARSP